MSATKGSGWLSMRLPEPNYLPTPSFGINRALGGQGLASGRISVYWGPKASGKSTMAYQQMAAAQRDGKTCAYVDSERAASAPWAEKNGVDLDAVLYKRENVAEEILLDVLPGMKSGEIDVLVVDSLSSIGFEMYFDTTDPGKNPQGQYARSAKMFTHKILSHLGPDQHVIFISHAAMDLSGWKPMLTASVGNAINHWASTVIRVQKISAQAKIRDDGSFPVNWTIEKSKQSVYPVSGSYYFNPRTAEIDTTDEVITYGVEEGLITKKGAWFEYDGLKAHGQEKLAVELMNDLDKYDQLKAELIALGVKEDASDEYAEA